MFGGLQDSVDDEITTFRLVDYNKKFIVGNHRGQLSEFSAETGECLQRLRPHSNEVAICRVDFANQLCVSAGWDGVVQIQSTHPQRQDFSRK